MQNEVDTYRNSICSLDENADFVWHEFVASAAKRARGSARMAVCSQMMDRGSRIEAM